MTSDVTDVPTSARSSGVFAWSAYDFINSLLIINGSLYYSAWITNDQHVNPFWYNFVFAVSTVVLLVALPLLGRFVDRSGEGMHTLLVLSLLIGFSALALPRLGNHSSVLLRTVGTLVVFGLINLLYQASLVAYNWLIPSLRGVRQAGPSSHLEDVRKVSGLGMAAGSIGSVVGAVLGVAILEKVVNGSRIDLFAWLGWLFLILMVWDYLLLQRGIEPDRPRDSSILPLVKDAYARTFQTVGTPGAIRRFFLSYFLFADALLTVQLNLPVFMRDRMHLSDRSSAAAVAISLTAGAFGSVLFAVSFKRVHPRKVLIWSLVGWVPVLLGFGVVRSWNFFLVLIVTAGALYGLLWSAARSYVVHLAPDGSLGTVFGVYSIFERASSVVGPIIWGGIMATTGFGAERPYLIAFAAMAFLVLVSIGFLRTPRSPSPGIKGESQPAGSAT